MAIWNRTVHYEDLVVEQRGRRIIAPLYIALLDLFSHLIYAIQRYYAVIGVLENHPADVSLMVLKIKKRT
jgi:glycerol-3-phosphate O-acyltransferase